jgi:tetratricopeptide (TPR) repeat protein
MEARRVILDMTTRLNQEFMRFREAALVAFGPSGHSGINLLIHNLRLPPDVPFSADEFIENADLQYILAGGMVEHLETLPPLPGREGLLRFQRDFMSLLLELHASPSLDNSVIRAAFAEKLEKMGERHCYIDINAINRAFSQEPTTMPFANLLINCSSPAEKGIMDKELLLFIIRDFRDLILNQQLAGDTLNRETTPDAQARQEGEKIMEALGLLQAAIEQYERIVTLDQWDELADAEEALTRAALLFEGALLVLKEFADREGRVPCIRCGTYNEPGDSKCYSCGAMIPMVIKEKIPALNIVEGEEGRGEMKNQNQMTANIFRLFDAADALSEGMISREEFVALVMELEKIVTRSQAALTKSPPAPEGPEGAAIKAALDEAHGLWGDAIKDFKAGLELFRDFSGSLSTVPMESAKERILQGMEKLKTVQALLHPMIKQGRNGDIQEQ